MMHGYPLVKKLCTELQDFMREHNFSSIEDFRGYVTAFTTLIVIFYMVLNIIWRNYLQKFSSLSKLLIVI
jgi:hypothetical protein